MGLRHPLTLHGYDRDFALSRHIHECHSYQSWHTWMRDVTLVISHGKRAATLHCIHTRIRVTCLIEEIRKACHTNTCMYLFCAVSVAGIRVTYLTYSCASLLRGLFARIRVTCLIVYTYSSVWRDSSIGHCKRAATLQDVLICVTY